MANLPSWVAADIRPIREWQCPLRYRNRLRGSFSVYRTNGDEVGQIERVMIDKLSGKVDLHSRRSRCVARLGAARGACCQSAAR